MIESLRVRSPGRRDFERYIRNLQRSKHRILVEGMRGKSSLVEILTWLLERRGAAVAGKITGLTPEVIYRGRKIPIDRGEDEKKFFLDHENVLFMANYPADIYVVENQAIKRATMRLVRRIYRPDIIVIPNVRYEHMEGLGDTPEQLTEAFLLGLDGVDLIIFSDPNPVNRKLFEELIERRRVESDVHIINVPEELSWIPAIERFFISRELLGRLGMEPLTEKEVEDLAGSLLIDLIPHSARDFLWYDASKANDPESTQLILNFILKNGLNEDRPVYVLACLRGDRIDRSRAFLDMFGRLRYDPRVERVWVTGKYLRPVLNTLGMKGSKLSHDFGEVIEVIERVRRDGGFLFLMVNGVCDFMDGIRRFLEAEEAESLRRREESILSHRRIRLIKEMITLSLMSTTRPRILA